MPGHYDHREDLQLEPRLFARLEEKKGKLDLHRPLAPAIARRLHEDLRIRLTYHSNAIEGNTLTLRETQVVIEEGITIGGHSLREHLEATNHAKAFDELRRLAESRHPLTLDTILRLHALVVHDIEEEAGTWRSQPVYIRGSDHRPPDARQVPELMRQWVHWLSGEGMNYHPIVRGAISHHGFVAVHPFIDGNGRSSRLLLNLQLLQDGYAPAFLLREWKLRYLQALQAADRGVYQPIINLIGQAVEAGLDFYLDACAAVPDEQYQLLTDLALQHGYDGNYLGLLARQGKLEARKWDRRWYTTPAALRQYEQEVQAEPRGRPPRRQGGKQQ
ncbi:MAG: Fic family protein [Chloroflexi bacterium]|nr:Fic family protein [Chloroflexota bacterium]